MANILVIDDEEDLRELVAKVLRRRGHNVLCASNGRRIVDPYCSDRIDADTVDLVITDIVMPDCEGIETISHLLRLKHSDGSRIKVIAISGGGHYASATDHLDLARRLGVEMSLAKPIDLSRLAVSVEEVLSGRASHGQIAPDSRPRRRAADGGAHSSNFCERSAFRMWW